MAHVGFGLVWFYSGIKKIQRSSNIHKNKKKGKSKRKEVKYNKGPGLQSQVTPEAIFA